MFGKCDNFFLIINLECDSFTDSEKQSLYEWTTGKNVFLIDQYSKKFQKSLLVHFEKKNENNNKFWKVFFFILVICRNM